MALSRVKTWVNAETLSHTDLNAEFDNILNNALTLISPLTANLNANNKQLTNVRVENTSSTPTSSASAIGRVVFQSTLGQLQVDDGTNIKNVPTIASVARGDVVYASAASTWARLAIGASGKVLASDGTDVAWGHPTAVTMGSSTTTATLHGTADTEITAGSTGADTNETTLLTYTLPANVLSANGKGVRVTAWGTCAANANNKTMQLYFGGTSVITSGAVAINNGSWRLQYETVRVSATTHDVTAWRIASATMTAVHTFTGAMTADTTATIIIKCTGTNGTASAADIVGEGMRVEFLN